MKPEAPCPWCGQWSPDVRHKVGDIWMHPDCCDDYLDGRLRLDEPKFYRLALAFQNVVLPGLVKLLEMAKREALPEWVKMSREIAHENTQGLRRLRARGDK